MTEEKKGRKSSRQFDLEKKPQRSFDLEKKERRTFDLEKETAPVSAPANSQPAPAGTGGNVGSTHEADAAKGGNKRKWLWLLALIVIVFIAVALFKTAGGSEGESTTPDMTVPDTAATNEQTPDSAATSSDTTATAGEASQPSSADEVPASEEATASQSAPAAVPSSQSATPASASSSTVSTATAADVQQAADRVLLGEFGNGLERKQRLGSNYAAIQARVNEMYRQGLVR